MLSLRSTYWREIGKIFQSSGDGEGKSGSDPSNWREIGEIFQSSGDGEEKSGSDPSNWREIGEIFQSSGDGEENLGVMEFDGRKIVYRNRTKDKLESTSLC